MSALFENGMSFLSRNVFGPLYQLRQGVNPYQYAAEVRAFSAWSQEEMKRHQLARLQDVVARAVTDVPYYRDIAGQLGLDARQGISFDEYSRFPLLTKDIIEEQKDRLVSEKGDRTRCRRGASGGSTRAPISYLLDVDAWTRRESATLAFNEWFGYRRGDRAAYLWGASQDFFAPSWKRSLYSAIIGRSRIFSSLALDEQSLETICRELKTHPPKMLQAYPSAIELLAAYIIETGKTVDVGCVTCTAEPFTEAQKELVRRAFGCEVFEWYGARECGRIATECSRHNGMHINAYGLYVEIVNEGESTYGEVLVTDLFNHIMPILRYSLNDYAALDESPCPCGCALPRISQIAGRASQTFFLKDGRKVPHVLATRIVPDNRFFLQQQIVQTDFDVFVVNFVPGKEFGPESHAWFKKQLDTYLGQDNHIEFHMVDSIPREPSGKIFYTKRTFDPSQPRRGSHD